MIALFFKNNKAERENDEAIVTQSQAALRDRMNHMLREDAKLAWMPHSTLAANDTAVKTRLHRARQFQFQIDIA